MTGEDWPARVNWPWPNARGELLELLERIDCDSEASGLWRHLSRVRRVQRPPRAMRPSATPAEHRGFRSSRLTTESRRVRRKSGTLPAGLGRSHSAPGAASTWSGERSDSNARIDAGPRSSRTGSSTSSPACSRSTEAVSNAYRSASRQSRPPASSSFATFPHWCRQSAGQ